MPAASGIDLHLHTTCSDGRFTPEAAAREAARQEVHVIAITDHDSVAGIAAARVVGEELGVTVVPGVELSCDLEGEELHLLGYGLDFRSARFLEALARFQGAREERNARILKRLRELGHDLGPEQVAAAAGEGSVARPHIAAALMRAGHVASISEAFRRFLGRGRPAFVSRVWPAPVEAIAALRQAGAIVSLAHPGKLADAGIVGRLAELGLRGLEVYHIDHTPGDIVQFSQLARELGLIETGGSDSHGPGTDRPVEIGAVPVPEEVWERLRAELSGRASADEPAPPRARA